MFRGLTSINLDPKGRLAIPKRYREVLQQASRGLVMLTIDTTSPCLLMYTLPQWEIIENKIQELPSFDTQARRLQRLLIGHATELEIDSHGRILVPSVLRDYGQFAKAINLVGQGNKFELWSAELWQTNRQVWLQQTSAAEQDQSVISKISI